MNVAGTQMTESEAETLVELLLQNREPQALSAAALIRVAIHDQNDVAQLTPAERDAVTMALETAWRVSDKPPEV